jgi:PHD/YefM family antitoxin component YafN of YafNO toxin-antitoxin module
MKTLELRNASKSLADYTADLDSESLVITSNKKPVAALISVKGTDRESLALSLSPDFAKIIRRARSEAKRGKVSSLTQVKEELLGSSASNTTTKRHRATKARHVPPTRKRR